MNEILFLCLCVALAVGLASLLVALSFGVGVGLFFYFRKRFSQIVPLANSISVSQSGESFDDKKLPNYDEERARFRHEMLILQEYKQREKKRPKSCTEIYAESMVEPMPPPPVVASWEPGERIGLVEDENDEEQCDNLEDNQ